MCICTVPSCGEFFFAYLSRSLVAIAFSFTVLASSAWISFFNVAEPVLIHLVKTSVYHSSLEGLFVFIADNIGGVRPRYSPMKRHLV